MSSAFTAIGTPSAGLASITRTWTTHLPSEPPNLVTLTSIQTETVHPTWIYTISDSERGPSSTATTVLDLVSPTLNPAPVTVTLTTTGLSTTNPDIVLPTAISISSTVSESATFTSSLTTIVSSSAMKDLPIPTTSELSEHLAWNSDAPSSIWISQTSLTSPSTPPSLPLPVFPEATTSSVSSVSASTISSTGSSTTPSISPVTGVVTSASASDTAQADQSHPKSTSKTGTIVGSVIGASAFTIFALLAFALFIRRRRRKLTTERPDTRQKLLRADSMTSSIGHCRYHSYPSMPGNISPRSPKLPVIPLQPSNPDLSLDSMYLRGERTTQDSFANPPSAVIEISAPSRSVSIYSSSSWGNGHGYPSWDCEREGADSLAVPRLSPGYLDTPMMRDSMRSDPFDLDLEPPPNAHHRPSAPPLPTPWGVKF
ncbi:hypothetical protein N7457_003147 [Penicillium paradoxum]|uniref:uncharacterized protein n=1 Tax=Penicillium paradoxum TaxID=176176 RepID=UPI002548E491|nr:uncharacterized protein N7457_003147 [Penicillium paradoxum]KAJ5788157.1 hypothetical protein N7457_003147 [Penicillium paradoxum]